MKKNLIDEEIHLSNVLQTIRDKIKQLIQNKPFPDVGKYSVASGYDEIDVLQHKKHTNEKVENEISHISKFIDSPYFARLDLECTDSNKIISNERHYVGNEGLIVDNNTLVHDWRSPVGQRYYLKNEVEFEHNKFHYTLLLRRNITVRKSKLIDYNNEYEFGKGSFSTGVTDPFLLNVLKDKLNNHKLTNIIKTIQENQNEIIRQPSNKNFIVQGCAGSGKTMIMLHRLSYLLFNNRNLNLEKIKIITPNENFNLHINDLSEELGLKQIERLTVGEYYLRLIKRYNKDLLHGRKMILNDFNIDSNFIDCVYSEKFFEETKNAFNSFLNDIISSIDIVKLKDINIQKNFAFELNDSNIIKYKIDNYLSFIKNILQTDSNRKAVNASEYKKIEEKDIEIENVIRNYDEDINIKNLQEQVNYFEKEKTNLIKTIVDSMNNICKKHNLNFIISSEFNYKFYNDKYNEIIDDFNKYNVKGPDLKDIMSINNEIMKNYENIQQIESKIEEIEKEYENRIEELEKAKKILIFNQEKSKNNILSNEEFLMFDSSRRTLGKIDPYFLYENTFNKLLIDVMNEYEIEDKIRREGNRYKLYLFLHLCYLYYGKIIEYDELLNIDEGQDLSIAEYKIIKLVNGNDVVFNIYGDTNQLITYKGLNDWRKLNLIKDKYTLNENYRNSIEITNYCNSKFNFNAVSIGIHGEGVLIQSEKEALRNIENINYENTRVRYALITDCERDNEFIMKCISAGCVIDGIKSNKVSIFKVEQAKGLEFDYVYIYDKNMTKNEKYIAYTRALSRLVIIKD